MNKFKRFYFNAIVVLIAIFAGIYLYRYYFVFGDATRAGTMYYFVHKGDPFKTYEGRLSQSGLRTPAQGNIQSNEFMFSVTDD